MMSGNMVPVERRLSNLQASSRSATTAAGRASILMLVSGKVKRCNLYRLVLLTWETDSEC